ncbi:hypothetical protein NDU88_002945 [Pleurodeles waltl]|uniref:Uncharacterized protein n=1 Tax=Pleurodeles waltl TaxID=8319 RepID=A0AAV7KX69_PLEWA|nr:hypothetical protein NDU88_002945 [Pleurodeles waltl]
MAVGSVAGFPETSEPRFHWGMETLATSLPRFPVSRETLEFFRTAGGQEEEGRGEEGEGGPVLLREVAIYIPQLLQHHTADSDEAVSLQQCWSWRVHALNPHGFLTGAALLLPALVPPREAVPSAPLP